MDEIVKRFKTSKKKIKFAMVGSMAVFFSYIFLFFEGVGPNFIALAWPGMILCTPCAYDVLMSLLNKEQ